MAPTLYPRGTLKKIVKAHANRPLSKNVDILVRSSFPQPCIGRSRCFDLRYAGNYLGSSNGFVFRPFAERMLPLTLAGVEPHCTEPR
jgi:hypothetical protein